MKSIIKPLLLALSSALFFFLGFVLCFANYNNSPQNEPELFGSRLSAVLRYISGNYVDSINYQQAETRAISAFLRELDPHSSFMPAEDFRLSQEEMEGEFEGIGIEFEWIRDTVCVAQVFKNSPASIAGLLPGDRLIKANQTLLTGISVSNQMAIKALKGPAKSTVKITLRRPGTKKLLSFEVKRNTVQTSSIGFSDMLAKEVGYIRLLQFSDNSKMELADSAKILLKRGMRQLVLDLRGNPGGLLNAAAEIADLFLTKEKTIVSVRGNKIKEEKFVSTEGHLLENTKVCILLDESSASASEVLAGALQDHDRGVIIGRRSFGKGLVQEQTVLQDGSAIRLTVARYYTPSGRCIQKPYFSGGNDDYSSEESDRYLSGELFSEDSIKPDTNKVFFTSKKRKIFGGGGIMPDYFIPLDTSSAAIFIAELNENGIIADVSWSLAEQKSPVYCSLSDIPSFSTNKLTDLLVPLVQKKLIGKGFIPGNEKKLLTDPRVVEKFVEGLTKIKFGKMAQIKRSTLSDPFVKKAVEILSSSNQ